MLTCHTPGNTTTSSRTGHQSPLQHGQHSAFQDTLPYVPPPGYKLGLVSVVLFEESSPPTSETSPCTRPFSPHPYLLWMSHSASKPIREDSRLILILSRTSGFQVPFSPARCREQQHIAQVGKAKLTLQPLPAPAPGLDFPRERLCPALCCGADSSLAVRMPPDTH